MATVRLTWAAPTTRASGKPLNPADIAGFVVEQSVDGGAFTKLPDSPPATTQRDVANLGPGVWAFRVSCFDTKNRTGAPQTGTVTISDDTPPSAVLNLTVAIQVAVVTTGT